MINKVREIVGGSSDETGTYAEVMTGAALDLLEYEAIAGSRDHIEGKYTGSSKNILSRMLGESSVVATIRAEMDAIWRSLRTLANMEIAMRSAIARTSGSSYTVQVVGAASKKRSADASTRSNCAIVAELGAQYADLVAYLEDTYWIDLAKYTLRAPTDHTSRPRESFEDIIADVACGAKPIESWLAQMREKLRTIRAMVDWRISQRATIITNLMTIAK